MYGAIIGDIIGSRFQENPIKTKKFKLFTDDSKFTDDTLMSLAIAKAVQESKKDFESLEKNAIKYMRYFGNKYKGRNYGLYFQAWLESEDPKPYNSYGNGAAMRVSACGIFYDNLEDSIQCAETVTKVTHNHIDAVKAAVATTKAIFMARHQASKAEIKQAMAEYYDLNQTLDDIRPNYHFETSSAYTMPAAIICFLEGKDYLDVIRNAVSLGGDSDTLAAIAGSIAGSFYAIDDVLKMSAEVYLYDDELIEILR